FFFQAEDGIRDRNVTGVQTCALPIFVRTASVALIHGADAAAKEGNIAAVERTHLVALFLQGIRIAIPAALLLAIPTSAVQSVLRSEERRVGKECSTGMSRYHLIEN